MGNTGDEETEDTNTDMEIELFDLDTPSVDNSQPKNMAAQTESRLVSRPPFLRRKSIMFSGTLICFVIGVFILANLSNAFSFISLNLLHLNSAIQAPVNEFASIPADVEQDGLACTLNAAWSPDSKRVAILGYSNNCTLDRYQTSLVNIYDASTHTRVAQIHPDNAIISVFTKLHPDTKGKPVILYNHVSWSPDGSKMALSFALSMPANPAILNTRGILVIEKGKQTVLLHPLPRENIPNVYFIWDLVQGISIQRNMVGSPLPPYLGFDLAPANAYSWKTGGFLVEQNEPLHSPVSPVGNPIGGTFFTPWQSGEVIGIPVANDGKDRYMWQTSFASWSPDGRYYTDIYTGAQLLLISHSPSNQQEGGKEGSYQFPTLIMQGKALEQLILLNAIVHKPFTLPLISWRPDGRVLAVYDDEQINLYDCVSGRKLRSLSPHSTTPVGLLEGTDTLSWSPNGKYLLLSSSIWGVMTLWKL